MSVSYRGMSIPLQKAGSPLPSMCKPFNVSLAHISADELRSSCAVQHSLPASASLRNQHELLRHVTSSLIVSAFATTPAFNLDDHFQLAGAVMLAARAVPEDVADILEVGSFQGHTALFMSSILHNTVADTNSRVHTVDSASWASRGIRRTAQYARSVGYPIEVHSMTGGSFGATWGATPRPLRLFFEDSKHDFSATAQSFRAFEKYVVEGGVVVMHDVVCTANEYPGLIRFLNEHILPAVQRNEYRELDNRAPEWEAIPAKAQAQLLGALERSQGTLEQARDNSLGAIMPRQRNITLEALARIRRGEPRVPCELLCKLHTANEKMSAGYAWSTCKNVRAFQRVPKQGVPSFIHVEAADGRSWDVDVCTGGLLAA